MTKLTSGKSDACKGYCVDYVNPVNPMNGNYYTDWHNCRCSICSKYLEWDGIYCPCCGYRVRRRPRASDAAIKCQGQRGMKRID